MRVNRVKHRPKSPPSAPCWWEAYAEESERSDRARWELDVSSDAFQDAEARGVVKRFSRQGGRIFISSIGGSGIADVVRFSEGVEIGVNNFVLPRFRRQIYIADEPQIILRASLSCGVTYTVEGHAPMVFNRPELTLVCLPRGMRIVYDGAAGVRQQGVNGIFRPSAFAEVYGLKPDDLPPVVRDAVLGPGRVGRVVSLPLEHRIASLVADTLDTPLEGEMRALQYAGRLSELVAYTFDAVQHAPAEHNSAILRRRDADLAQQALARLARDYRQPPLFKQLARELATNANKLQASFKGAFGITMAEYCLDRRMREAQELLLQGNLSIAQVAERVGYAHQSNFAAAFSDHVGMAPREYRRHRAPFSLSLGVIAGAGRRSPRRAMAGT